jgi:hypothetical protein
VAYPRFAERFGGSAANPSAAKVEVMKRLLDGIEAIPVTSMTALVINHAGNGKEPLHWWGFSDDDIGNFSTAVTALSQEVKQGKWPHVKITIIYTGRNNPSEKSRAVVIMRDGKSRLVQPDELKES